MKSFREWLDKEEIKEDAADPGLDNSEDSGPYKFSEPKRYNITVIKEDENYKLTNQDKKDLKELFETWENLKYNIDNELVNFKEDNIYRNNIAKYRMDKVRKILPLIKKMRSDWNKR